MALSCAGLLAMVRFNRSFLLMENCFASIMPMFAWFSLLIMPLMLALLVRYACMSSMPLMVTG